MRYVLAITAILLASPALAQDHDIQIREGFTKIVKVPRFVAQETDALLAAEKKRNDVFNEILKEREQLEEKAKTEPNFNIFSLGDWFTLSFLPSASEVASGFDLLWREYFVGFNQLKEKINALNKSALPFEKIEPSKATASIFTSNISTQTPPNLENTRNVITEIINRLRSAEGIKIPWLKVEGATAETGIEEVIGDDTILDGLARNDKTLVISQIRNDCRW